MIPIIPLIQQPDEEHYIDLQSHNKLGRRTDMTHTIFILLVGLVIGSNVGFLVASLMAAARRAEDQAEKQEGRKS